ncbi:MAG TPA: ATP-binding protein [Acidimicrobiales bacterium]|jgi:anti-sigma regulatory factor (Ser/Thr protein kinase)|nr:ATP-binding protein [Acidimicrobiales bacterium]
MRLALDLILPADTRLLAATRRALTLYLKEFGTPAEIVDDVILALDEACSNVLVHAFPNGFSQGATYRVRADLRPERIQIDVHDEGVGFDVMAKPPPRDADAHLSASGRGLEVMRRLMTTVEIESPTATGGTRLRMVRKLASPADSD